jgi:hypothetical protein
VASTAAAAAASLQVDSPVASEEVTAANAASAATENEELNQSIGKMIQDLAHSDNAKVKAALDMFDKDFMRDKRNVKASSQLEVVSPWFNY